MKSDKSERFGDYLRRIRIDKGFRQSDVGDALNFTSVYIHEIESNKKPPPRKEILEKIAKCLGVNKDEMFNRADFERGHVVLPINSARAYKSVFALRLARSWDRLSVEEVERMMEVINNK